MSDRQPLGEVRVTRTAPSLQCSVCRYFEQLSEQVRQKTERQARNESRALPSPGLSSLLGAVLPLPEVRIS